MNCYHRKLGTDRRKSRGVALIVALLTLLLFSTLLAALLFGTNTQIWASYNYRLGTQARYTAEMGAQNAINWLVYTYTKPTNLASFDMTKSPVQYNGQPVVLSAIGGVASNYPDAAQQSAFNSALNGIAVSGMGVPANYSVYATLLRMRSFNGCFSTTPGLVQTWQITAQGTIGGMRAANAQVIETYENPSTPCFTYAAYATKNQCSSMDFQGNTITDSYDSSGGYLATKQNTGGDIGTAGNILSQSTTNVGGAVGTPTGVGNGTPCSGNPMPAVSGNALTTTEGLQAVPPPPFPTPTIPATPTNNDSRPSGTVLPPGTYGNLQPNGTMHLQAGTYNFNSFCTDSGPVTVVIDSGPVIVNLGGNSPVGPTCNSGAVVDLQAGGVINSGGIPSNFQLVYGGTLPIVSESGLTMYGLLYAPKAPVNLMSSASSIYGAAVFSTGNFQSNADLHYDRALGQSIQIAGSYHPVSFSRSKF